MEPKSLTEADTPPDRRLRTLIEEARLAGASASSVKHLDRAQADREFSHIAAAIERGLKAVDARSADAAVLKRLRDAVRNR